MWQKSDCPKIEKPLCVQTHRAEGRYVMGIRIKVVDGRYINGLLRMQKTPIQDNIKRCRQSILLDKCLGV